MVFYGIVESLYLGLSAIATHHRAGYLVQSNPDYSPITQQISKGGIF